MSLTKRVMPRISNLLGLTRHTSGTSETASKSLRGLNIVLVDYFPCAAPSVVTPANGADLYWFDEFNVGVEDHVSGSKFP